MCCISRCWLDSMIIAEVWLRLATIKGHSLKCAVLLYWGGPGWGGWGGGGGWGVQKPVSDSVSGVTIICLMQCNTSPSHRVDVDCGRWNVGPLLFNGSCWILAGTGMRCRIRRSRASKTCSTGDMSSSDARMAVISAGAADDPRVGWVG